MGPIRVRERIPHQVPNYAHQWEGKRAQARPRTTRRYVRLIGPRYWMPYGRGIGQ